MIWDKFIFLSPSGMYNAQEFQIICARILDILLRDGRKDSLALADLGDFIIDVHYALAFSDEIDL